MTNKIEFNKFDLESYVGQYADKDEYKSREGDAWFKCCFHEEKTASLRVSNKQVFYCHGCGASGGVLDFIEQHNKVSKREAIKIVGDYSGQEVVAMDVEPILRPFYEPTDYDAKYIYNNGYVLKYRLPQSSKVPYIWGNYDGENWWMGTGEHNVQLYAPNGLSGTVVLAEGEKDADVLCAMGFNGASSPNGTYKWKSEYTDELKESQRVVILNDNDYPGISGAQLCQHFLKGGDVISKRVSPLEIEHSEESGFDISDVVELIGQEETKIRLQAIIDNGEMWDVLWNEESNETITETVEVEIVYESGIGEEYDNLIQKAVSETLNQGMQDESTTLAIREYSKTSGIGIRDISKRIKLQVEQEKNKVSEVNHGSAIVRIDELDLDVDISGSGYYLDNYEGGIYDQSQNEIIGHFLGFVGVVVDAESEQDKDVKVALAYNTPQNKSIKMLIVPKRKLSSSNDIVEVLSGYNINVTSVNALLVVKYLQDLQNHFKDKTVTMKSLSRFGWFDGYLIPYEQAQAQIVFDSSVAQPVANKLLGQVGDKETSRDLMQKIATYSESNAIIMGTSVASLVLSYINDGGNQSFALNVWAATSTGKSVTCQGVSSMLGYPFKDNGWWGAGDATLNADMNHNELLSHLPNFIDDPALNRNYDSYQKRDYIYKVTSGQSRARMERDGRTAQEKRTWCNTVIMTNETQFIDDNVHEGGARARCLEINFDKPLTTPIVEEWLETMRLNYGHFGVDIANKIRSLGKKELETRLKEYIRYFNSNGIDGKRTINASYVMLGLDVAKEALEIESVDPREWFIKQIKGSGELSPGARAYDKLIARAQVSENVYRNIEDRNGVFIGSFGYSESGAKVINLAVRTIQQYGEEDKYNYAELIHWGYANNKMVSRYNENDNPTGIVISNGVTEIKVVQVYYDWQGVQYFNDIGFAGEFTVINEFIDVE